MEEDFKVDFTLHDFPACLLAEFSEKIAKPYFGGKIKTAVQELIYKAIVEQDLVLSRIELNQKLDLGIESNNQKHYDLHGKTGGRRRNTDNDGKF